LRSNRSASFYTITWSHVYFGPVTHDALSVDAYLKSNHCQYGPDLLL
jgi:hypothetical protein